jgi:vanillate O-demethylase ferredoxin subunit
MAQLLINARVTRKEKVANTIVRLELTPIIGSTMTPFEAGSHIELHLPNGITRSYSLVNYGDVVDRYVIAVGLSETSKGGSRYVFDNLAAGQVVTSGLPRNNFPFREKAVHSVFIAGGIGITPIVSMIRRAEKIRASWELHYATRTRDASALYALLADCVFSGDPRVHEHFDDECGRPLNVGEILARCRANADADADAYCCGPVSMLETYEAATAANGFRPERVHLERFTSGLAPANTGGFTVILQRQGREVKVLPGSTILDALLVAGVDAPFSCREGICGSCEVRVIEGTPDHRDAVLSETERASNQSLMICCSGCRSGRLVLDL